MQMKRTWLVYDFFLGAPYLSGDGPTIPQLCVWQSCARAGAGRRCTSCSSFC
jgi:hypothetical protein